MSPIANYTTKVNVKATVAEIQDLLAKHGATDIMVSYVDGEADALTFAMQLHGRVAFRLPSNWPGVHAVLVGQRVENRYSTDEHAKRVAWRVTRDWVRAQLAMIEAGLATLPQVMLPYAVTPDGRTLSERIEAGDGPKLLGGA